MLTFSLTRVSVLRYFRYALKITELRGTLMSVSGAGVVHPLLDILCIHKGIHERVMSYLDPHFCLISERRTLLAIWRILGSHDDWLSKGETALRQGHGDDVYRWYGIELKGGRVVGITWVSCAYLS